MAKDVIYFDGARVIYNETTKHILLFLTDGACEAFIAILPTDIMYGSFLNLLENEKADN
jgi:hypothetical protein